MVETTSRDGIDISHYERHGWVRVPAAVPARLCKRLVEALECDVGVPVSDRTRWHEYGDPLHDHVPVWGHQAQWDIRQHPRLHCIWSRLCGTEALWITLDSCRFTPPWRPGRAEPYGIHWDRDPRDAKIVVQGVLALTDTTLDQGGFRCVPSLYRDRGAWPMGPVRDAEGHENWLADPQGREIVHVPARTGDLIAWSSRLPHGNSKNLATLPRLAFYVSMSPAGDPALRDAAIDSWRTGRCVPWWRTRPGYDRIEPWPPARLTRLGRRLLGVDAWSTP